MPVIIKRYPNRKLYNTQTKQYITLDEIAGLIQDDIDVSVQDAQTGENITAFVFTQVIMGREKRKTGVIPTGLLRAVIRASADDIVEVSQYLQNPFEWLSHRMQKELPTRGDIKLLSDRIEKLSNAIDALSNQNSNNQR